MNQIWIEKFRPTSLDEIVGNKGAVAQLQGILTTGSMPHLLLSGPPGIGKTSALLCVARGLLGDDFANAVLEMNASDERGIDVVREKIKNFARKVVTLPEGRTKLIILDEADSMTEAAQQALRRIMEVYSNTTRFALACNQSTKIIEPIQSRCAMIRFTKIDDEDMKSAMRRILNLQNIPHSEEALDVVVVAAEGDLRRAVGTLQTATVMFKQLSVPSVYKASDIPPTNQIRDLLSSCVEGNWRDAHENAFTLLRDGYNTSEVLKSIMALIQRTDCPIEDKKRVIAMKELIRVMAHPVAEHPSKIQLDKALCSLCMVFGRDLG